MRYGNSHDQDNAQPPEEFRIQLIKRKCKENIDKGKTPPPDQLKKPVMYPFFLHRTAKLINPLPGDPINIPVVNWYYKWDVQPIYQYKIIDLEQLSTLNPVTQSLTKKAS